MDKAVTGLSFLREELKQATFKETWKQESFSQVFFIKSDLHAITFIALSGGL